MSPKFMLKPHMPIKKAVFSMFLSHRYDLLQTYILPEFCYSKLQTALVI